MLNSAVYVSKNRNHRFQPFACFVTSRATQSPMDHNLPMQPLIVESRNFELRTANCFLLSLRHPDTKVSAAMEQAHQVKHPVKIPLSPHRNRRSPQLFDECFFIGPRCRRKPASSGRRHHSHGMPCRQRLSLQRVLICKRTDAFAYKELLDAIAQLSLVRVLAPPTVIHRPVAHRPP